MTESNRTIIEIARSLRQSAGRAEQIEQATAQLVAGGTEQATAVITEQKHQDFWIEISKALAEGASPKSSAQTTSS